MSKDFTKDKISEILLRGTAYDFSTDHSVVEKEVILNIHDCLIIKNNIK